MDNRPGLIADSLIEFGQGGDYHTHSMTEAKESAGFAPLETLPAEWYNNYLYKLDAHINQLQTLTRQLQQELSNLLTTAPTPIEPSATDLTQVKAAINQMIEDRRPVIATGSEPGLVVSSAQMSSVSVDSNGVMTPNALSDYTSEDTVQEQLDEAKRIATTTQTGNVLASATTNLKGVSVNSTTGAMTVNALSDWSSTKTVEERYKYQCISFRTGSSATENFFYAGCSVQLSEAPQPGLKITLDVGLIHADIRYSTNGWTGIGYCAAGVSGEQEELCVQVYYNTSTKVLQVYADGYTRSKIYIDTDNIQILFEGYQDFGAKTSIATDDNPASGTHLLQLNIEDMRRYSTRATYATYATYLTSGTSTLVTADNAGNLKAHTLELT